MRTLRFHTGHVTLFNTVGNIGIVERRADDVDRAVRDVRLGIDVRVISAVAGELSLPDGMAVAGDVVPAVGRVMLGGTSLRIDTGVVQDANLGIAASLVAATYTRARVIDLIGVARKEVGKPANDFGDRHEVAHDGHEARRNLQPLEIPWRTGVIPHVADLVRHLLEAIDL